MKNSFQQERFTKFLHQLRLPSPVQQIQLDHSRDYQIIIKRDDLIHPYCSGNKWRKLHLNIRQILASGNRGMITFGGPFSNHLYACAAICKAIDIDCVFIIRGHQATKLSPTLKTVKSLGASLYFVSRQAYALNMESDHILEIVKQFPGYSVIPEGGSNILAAQGMKSVIDELEDQLDNQIDYLFTAVGTGGSYAGLLNAVSKFTRVIGIQIVNDDRVIKRVNNYLIPTKKGVVKLIQDYDFGGYAKYNETLISYINQFWLTQKIPLDIIYTGKMFFGFEQMLKNAEIETGSTIVLLHTGGLQGNTGFNWLHPGLLNHDLLLQSKAEK